MSPKCIVSNVKRTSCETFASTFFAFVKLLFRITLVFCFDLVFTKYKQWPIGGLLRTRTLKVDVFFFNFAS